eukprot:15431514-Alexandrium_andersonii.AAC.1
MRARFPHVHLARQPSASPRCLSTSNRGESFWHGGKTSARITWPDLQPSGQPGRARKENMPSCGGAH